MSVEARGYDLVTVLQWISAGAIAIMGLGFTVYYLLQ